MLGIIDVGGGLRDTYGAGVFDRCIDEGYTFDYCLGISAGSVNLTSFIAGCRGKNYEFFLRYSELTLGDSILSVLKGRPMLDLDTVYSGLVGDSPNSEIVRALKAFPGVFKIAVTDASTGTQSYFDRSLLYSGDPLLLKASSALPVFCKTYNVEGVTCFDGGISDPIPFKQAFKDGCDKVVIVLTTQTDRVKTSKKDGFAKAALKRKYPNASDCIGKRCDLYNEELKEAFELEKQGKVLILAPKNDFGMGTLSRDRELMQKMYAQGYEDGLKIGKFIGTEKTE